MSLACALAAWAVTVFDKKPAVAWASVQALNPAACEMGAAEGS